MTMKNVFVSIKMDWIRTVTHLRGAHLNLCI